MDVLSTPDTWAWIGWIVLILVFVVIEMLTGELTFLMLSGGSAAGLLSDLLGAPLWMQAIVAALAAVALLTFLRPPLLRRLHRGADERPSGVDALLGLQGLVLSRVSPSVPGQVKLTNGDVWTARSDTGIRLDPATRVEVVRIDGATAVVRAVVPRAHEKEVAT
ncbi:MULTISPECIES: NfeD family protein [Microbacterium]|uniref:Membrane protein n=1 Tax=Microbacterium testaceum TaxID=2033 RepID=A0A4Y3QKE4_MICTE|nr:MULTISPECIES: NfeD family protein [Microbacterium]WAC69008.1 NfeD family protein [Microbacterium sp. SL75]GEB45744.1 membrane protein [Microbacterium testaceum]